MQDMIVPTIAKIVPIVPSRFIAALPDISVLPSLNVSFVLVGMAMCSVYTACGTHYTTDRSLAKSRFRVVDTIPLLA